MAEQRVRIQKQLEKSAVAGSLVRTDASNEQEYLAPGTDGQLLTLLGGLPTWADKLIVSADAENSITIGTDGGAYYNAPNIVTGASWDDATNQLVLSFTEGADVNVPIVDTIANFIHTHTLSDGTNTTDVTNGDTVTLSGTQGITATVGTDSVTFGLPIGTADGEILVWNNTTGEYEVQAPTPLTTEQEDVSTALTSGTDVVLTQTPAVGTVVTVYRNGIKQIEGAANDYTRSGTTITFTIPFGISGGAAGDETVSVVYKY